MHSKHLLPWQTEVSRAASSLRSLRQDCHGRLREHSFSPTGPDPGIHLSSRRGNEFIALRLPQPLLPVYSQVSNELPKCISEECFRTGIQSAGLPMQRSPCRILGVILPVFSAFHKCNMIWKFILCPLMGYCRHLT